MYTYVSIKKYLQGILNIKENIYDIVSTKNIKKFIPSEISSM